jgi:hypothetical protein
MLFKYESIFIEKIKMLIIDKIRSKMMIMGGIKI